jgi:hypothetical protein
MNALLNEYIAWRNYVIKDAFDEGVADADALQDYVSSEVPDFHYQYNDHITLSQYKQIQQELILANEDFIEIIEHPVSSWCFIAIRDDDWDKLFNDNKPESESESEEEVPQA